MKEFFRLKWRVTWNTEWKHGNAIFSGGGITVRHYPWKWMARLISWAFTVNDNRYWTETSEVIFIPAGYTWN